MPLPTDSMLYQIRKTRLVKINRDVFPDEIRAMTGLSLSSETLKTIRSMQLGESYSINRPSGIRYIFLVTREIEFDTAIRMIRDGFLTNGFVIPSNQEDLNPDCTRLTLIDVYAREYDLEVRYDFKSGIYYRPIERCL